MRKNRSFFWLCETAMFLFLFASLGSPLIGAKVVSSDFETILIDKNIEGPAFATIVDVDLDGEKEILVSSFGKIGFRVPNGELILYKKNGSLNSWDKTIIAKTSDGIKFPNKPEVYDVSGNGLPDIILPSGFLVCDKVPFGKACGGITIFEQVSLGKYVKRELIKPKSKLFYHTALFKDLDGDGQMDMISVGERMGNAFQKHKNLAVPVWFKGIAKAPYFEAVPRPLGKKGLGGLPVFYDITGNGTMDIVSAEYFHRNFASFTWFEQVSPVTALDPNGVWERHIIDDQVGPAIQLKMVENLYGDGKTRAVGSNHTNTANKKPDPWESAIYVYDIPENPRDKWPRQKISSGIRSRKGSLFMKHAAPGIFGTGDLNGNGKIDILVSGDGDDRVFWLEQVAPGDFNTHVILEKFGQAGSMEIADLDGDQLNEGLVSSYETNELMIIKFKSSS